MAPISLDDAFRSLSLQEMRSYQESDKETQTLVKRLRQLRNVGGRKANIRSTPHNVLISNHHNSQAALIEELNDEEESQSDTTSDLKNMSEAVESTIVVTSWKTNEFAYRKTSKIGYTDQDELPTLARGLFTITDQNGHHRILVRGYDKFFNEGEMPWTKVSPIIYSFPSLTSFTACRHSTI